MQFRQVRPQDKKDTAFETFGTKTEFFCSISVKHAHIDGTTIFHRHSFTICAALESCQLAVLKYSISATRNVKKLQLSKGQIWTKKVLPKERIAVRSTSTKVWDNFQKRERKAYSKGGLLFTENWTTAFLQKGWLRIFRRKGERSGWVDGRGNGPFDIRMFTILKYNLVDMVP